MYKIVVGTVFGLLLSNSAMAVCSSYPYTLTNGTTADATQVMADLNCAALTSGATIDTATLTGNTTLPGSGQIKSTGGIGIGTAASSVFPLLVQSSSIYLADFSSTNAAGGIISVSNSGNSVGSIGAASSQVTSGNVNDLSIRASLGAMVFALGSTEVGRWGTDGSFLVAEATNAGWAGNAKMEVKQSAIGQTISAWMAASAGTAYLARVDNASSNFMTLYYGNTLQVGSITTSGTSVTYNTTSDERLKDWDIPQQNYASAIQNLWVGDFHWKANGQPDFGIRAQQAYHLFPAAIHKPADERTGHWEADYGRLAPLALWGVKDLYKSTSGQAVRLTAQQKQIASFAAQISFLKAANDNQATKMAKLETEISTLERRVNTRTAQK